jgi:hypothetical protein
MVSVAVPPDEALARSVRWEREQTPIPAIDYAAEDAALAALDDRPAVSRSPSPAFTRIRLTVSGVK